MVDSRQALEVKIRCGALRQKWTLSGQGASRQELWRQRHTELSKRKIIWVVQK